MREKNKKLDSLHINNVSRNIQFYFTCGRFSPDLLFDENYNYNQRVFFDWLFDEK